MAEDGNSRKALEVQKAIMENKDLIGDLSAYDSDNDGRIDCLHVVCAYRSGGTYYLTAIWSGNNLELYDGKKMTAYALLGEDDCGNANTPLHETGHLMGLPDNYESSSVTCVLPKGCNDLMGGRVQDGKAKEERYNFNALYRYLLEWDDVEIFPYENAMQELELYPTDVYDESLADKRRSIALIKESETFPITEFYIMEYRAKHRDERLEQTASGIIVWHCDVEDHWNGGYSFSNEFLKPVFKSRTEEDFKCADMYFVGDEFSDKTNPSSKFYDDVYTGAYMKVLEIDESKAKVLAGFQNIPMPRVTLQEPNKTYVRKYSYPTVMDEVVIPIRAEDIQEADIDVLREQLEFVTTGDVTYMINPPKTNVFNINKTGVGTGQIVLQHFYGNGTIQVRIPEGFARYENRYTAASNWSAVITVDSIKPTGTVEYSTTEQTNGDVIATLIPSEEIQPTEMTHTFTENGEYTFTFKDLAGNEGRVTAVVDWIDKTPREDFIEFTKVTGTVVSAKLVFGKTEPPMYNQMQMYLAYKKDGVLQHFELLGVEPDLTTGFLIPQQYKDCDIEAYVWDNNMRPLMSVQRAE